MKSENEFYFTATSNIQVNLESGELRMSSISALTDKIIVEVIKETNRRYLDIHQRYQNLS